MDVLINCPALLAASGVCHPIERNGDEVSGKAVLEQGDGHLNFCEEPLTEHVETVWHTLAPDLLQPF